MKKILILLVTYLLLCSHDMFLKLDTYHLEPNTPAAILLYNGTFERSDNIITRDRMIDVSLVGNGQRMAVDTASWTDKENTSILNFTTGASGTWLAGVSTKARNIELAADDFNDYLQHDGVLDMLEYREQNDLLDSDAIEKYSKHVKVIFQVGDKKTDDWQTYLGYPIEFVPLSNPYDAKVGSELKFKLLWKGNPLADQLVFTGNSAADHSHGDHSAAHHSHDADSDDHHHDATKLRTDEDGIATVELSHAGHWYVRTIMMEESEESGLTHESNWATLTFEIQQDADQKGAPHRHSDGTVHTHEGEGFSSSLKYLLAFVGIIILGGILWMTKRRK